MSLLAKRGRLSLAPFQFTFNYQHLFLKKEKGKKSEGVSHTE